MSSLFKIRKTEDMELVKSLNDEIFPYDELETKEKTHAWIVTVKKVPVGFCTVDFLSYGIAFLARAGLKTEARGFNLQKKLISVRERFAKKNGYYQIITYTMMDNIWSSVNLQKKGYCLYLPEYEYAGKGCLYWRRKLV